MYKEKAYYCSGCKKKHESWSWNLWGKRRFCKDWMKCYGCKTIHKTTGYAKGINNPDGSKETVWLCSKWAKPSAPTPQQKAQNMSPEEVMSGVHYGMDRVKSMSHDSEDWSVEHKQQLDYLNEVL